MKILRIISKAFFLLVPLTYCFFAPIPGNMTSIFIVRLVLVAIYALLANLTFFLYFKSFIEVKIVLSVIFFAFYIGVYLIESHILYNLFLYENLQRFFVFFSLPTIPLLSYIPSIIILISIRNYEKLNNTLPTIYSKPIYQQIIFLLSYIIVPFAPVFLWYKNWTFLMDYWNTIAIIRYVFDAVCLALFVTSVLLFKTHFAFKIAFISLYVVLFGILLYKNIIANYVYLENSGSFSLNDQYKGINVTFALSIIPILHFFIPGSYFINIVKFAKRDNSFNVSTEESAKN